MATKAELEAKVASLEEQVARLTTPPETVAVEEPGPLSQPSPVDRGQLYVESHPILGVTRTAHVVSQSIGDGRIGDGAEIVRS